MFHTDEHDESTRPYQPASYPYQPAQENAATPSNPVYQPVSTVAAAQPSYPAQEAGAPTSTMYRNQGTKVLDSDATYPPAPEAYQADHDEPTAYPSFAPPPGPGAPPANPPYRPDRGGRGLRTGAIIALTVVLLAVFGTGLFAGWEFGHSNSASSSTYTVSPLQAGTQQQTNIQPLSGNNITAVREQVVANVRPAVVQITVTIQSSRGTQQGLGSGVIIDKRGYIVTNYHVVEGAQSIDEVALADGTKITNATIVGTDPADDLAVIKITPPPNMAVANLGDSSKLVVGQDVLAIGNPLGITQTVTNGIVSAVGRNISEGQGGAFIPNAIQTDAPINPGNSGGALVDLQGNVIGIPTLTAVNTESNTPANGVGFAIPSNRVKFIVSQIIQDGKVTHTGRAGLGIRGTSVDQMVQAEAGLSVDHGVLISEVVSGGAADKAGLRAGDVIVQVDNQATDSQSALQDVLITKNLGDKVSIKVYRGDQQVTVTATLGELQSGS